MSIHRALRTSAGSIDVSLKRIIARVVWRVKREPGVLSDLFVRRASSDGLSRKRDD
jgi:hypothetical protein